MLLLLVFDCIFASSILASQRQPESIHRSLPMDTSLRQFLQKWDHGESREMRYIAAFRDLNGDGMPEAIVYVKGNDWCGSGGCTTLILTQDGDSWRIISQITLTRPPIIVLGSTSHGWSDIGMRVQGGGIRRGYEAELRFNGKTYPSNPSVFPARPLKRQPKSRDVVIASENDGLPLY
jgi:hypothetical protein